MSELNICERNLSDVDEFINALARESANTEMLACPLTEPGERTFCVPTTTVVEVNYV